MKHMEIYVWRLDHVQSTLILGDCRVPYTTKFHPGIATFPGGLVVRIRRSHRRGRGSIPRLGTCFSLIFGAKPILMGPHYMVTVYVKRALFLESMSV